MMDFLKPITPQYKGTTTQSNGGGGLLSQLFCYLFAGGTPAYQGSGQPVAKGCSVPGFPAAPAYKEPPVVDQREPTDTPELGTSDDVAGCEDPTQAMGPITIVVR